MKPPTLQLSAADALVIVDVQTDFLPGGRLAVPDGDQVIAPLNRYIDRFDARGLPIFATRDWHPEAHCSFLPQGGAWPPHCVAESPGAAFAPGLRLPKRAVVISKGTRKKKDAYSGFEGTDLAGQLKGEGAHRLFIGGLATDYCVQATVQDALAEGFEVVLLADAIRAVNVRPGDGERALARMAASGAVPVTLREVIS